ncbi:glycosyltransferase family 4 protein [Cyclobacterium sp. 1_MG-2023]|uniref:MraY family glycosyltransferase n=1 Tax=Cyclobacterium sp. 1_MG-2023 TaxID=3062681 RepID=UPI0026E3F529|nr:glycosyltransferase family 4 protein [Cyclobacterium sp. 1_MG-2023]MDO6440375.1 glycosyltransferase family 4 protein [Cyclobacterium sp. 1_MG-2023]
MYYIIVFLLLLVAQLLYFIIAKKFSIIDKPNERSSHTKPTIRGGGVIFVLAVLLAWIMGVASWPLALGIVLVGAVSMVDDIRPLHQLPRISVHLLATGLLIYDISQGTSLGLWIPVLFFLLIGWTNLFNFMDGINGITVLYALVALITFYQLPALEGDQELIALVGISSLVFAWFNVRKKAKTFAGDVGSISMAMVLGYLMIKVIFITQNPFYLFFFSLYGIDACMTIFIRLSKKENIFNPHRTHLYQYLANEKGFSHLSISFAYAGLQLLINLVWIYGVGLSEINWLAGLVFVAVLIPLYFVLRKFAQPAENNLKTS